jgi:branched-subunit amino acid aminotransferase/4-amino-4-deoxychorismate lyase
MKPSTLAAQAAAAPLPDRLSRDGKLCTPTDRNVLQGVTRATVFELEQELGIPVVEGDFTPYDV